ncbi:LAMP2 [Branchiostoma lanceolatum]|uniref:Lysosome-associated membrane glycoprotein 5 n=1 Tax=Branchiostoma lanceolatum TaxID=7740 RepID=A0A8K0ABA6_BRALA|nr:LAMP2 [Branchiostoma lanceolatum]
MADSRELLALFLPILFLYFVLGTTTAGVMPRFGEIASEELADATTMPPPPLPPPAIGHFNVSDSSTGVRCILVQMGVQFKIQYDSKDGDADIADFQLSPYADDSGSCVDGQGLAAILLQWPLSDEGPNYQFTLSFKKDTEASEFHLNDIVLNYNLTEDVFPDANETNAIKTVEIHDIQGTFSAPLGQSYKCRTEQTVQIGNVATINFVGVQLQPFEVKGDVFDEPKVCSEDMVTTPAPTTRPAPPLPPPTVGHFNVTDPNSGAMCILVSLGLQFKIQYDSRDGDAHLADFQLSPQADVGGECDNGQGEASILMRWPLGADDKAPYTLALVFTKVRNTFSLTGLVFNYNLTADDFPDANDTQKTITMNDLKDQFSAPVGQSYKCEAEQTLQDGTVATLNFVGVQLQPFEVKENSFGAPRVCSEDLTTTPRPPGPSTTAYMPLPIPGDWKVTNSSGMVCMRVKASVQFKAKYYKTDGTMEQTDLTVPPHINATGTCAGATGNSASLVLAWDNLYTVTIKFSKDIGTDSTSFKLNNIQVEYTVNADGFPECRDCGTNVRASNLTVNAYHGKVGRALTCTTPMVIPVDTNVTMKIAELEAQPFAIGRDGQFGETDQCPQDGTPSGGGASGGTIALAVCLTLFVVIAIGVTCFFYRKKKSQYQSI